MSLNQSFRSVQSFETYLSCIGFHSDTQTFIDSLDVLLNGYKNMRRNVPVYPNSSHNPKWCFLLRDTNYFTRVV